MCVGQVVLQSQNCELGESNDPSIATFSPHIGQRLNIAMVKTCHIWLYNGYMMVNQLNITSDQ
jgi:hypothetical protein